MLEPSETTVRAPPETFEDFYGREYPAVVGLAYALSGSRWGSEDLAQEAFFAAHRDWGRIGSYQQPGAWVRRVVANLAVSAIRRRVAETKALARMDHEWSPDGSWIVFQRPHGQLYLVHPDGSALHRVPLQLPPGTGAPNPSWSPDGTSIVFSLQRSDRAEIYMVRPDGTGLRKVTGAPGAQEQEPDWGFATGALIRECPPSSTRGEGRGPLI